MKKIVGLGCGLGWCIGGGCRGGVLGGVGLIFCSICDTIRRMKKSKSDNLVLGYMDESGEPGVAKNLHDYFVVCIVIVDDREKSLKLSARLNDFRLKNNLPEDCFLKYPSRVSVRKAYKMISSKMIGCIEL